jgi:predicted membrane-bound spermidine synthase
MNLDRKLIVAGTSAAAGAAAATLGVKFMVDGGGFQLLLIGGFVIGVVVTVLLPIATALVHRRDGRAAATRWDEIQATGGIAALIARSADDQHAETKG